MKIADSIALLAALPVAWRKQAVEVRQESDAVRRDAQYASGETYHRELRQAEGLRAEADDLEDRAEALELLMSLNGKIDAEVDAADLDLASAILILRAFAAGAASLDPDAEDDPIPGAIAVVIAAAEKVSEVSNLAPAQASVTKILPLGTVQKLDAPEVRAASHAAHKAGFHAASLDIAGCKVLIIAQPKAPFEYSAREDDPAGLDAIALPTVSEKARVK
jgi:hypothetical protein